MHPNSAGQDNPPSGSDSEAPRADPRSPGSFSLLQIWSIHFLTASSLWRLLYLTAKLSMAGPALLPLLNPGPVNPTFRSSLSGPLG
ncbi:hypothetical protein A6R68_20491 [Neotoma lepida]|uniref:Uncharacterized protein n=1 Tax=Neotoma lepida TaxID=56216 RepID=A0A1A6HSY1_NEOLE|nr:hypothetical protein A6R68_20491 [Neotoma lepida]